MVYRRLALLLIFCTALGVRLAYLAANPYPLLAPPIEGEMAHNIVDHGRWFEINERSTRPAALLRGRGSRLLDPGKNDYRQLDRDPLWRPEVLQPVGSAVLLAGLWQIFGGERYLPLQVLQAIVDALVALLVYWIAMRLFRQPAAAILAASLYAIYPPIAAQSTIPYVDIWAADFTVLVVAVYLEGIDSPRRWSWLLACGLLTGIGVYFRPNLLLLPGILAVASLPRIGRREAFRRGIAITAVAVVLMTPWTIRNFNDFHAFIPTTSGLGQTLWEGLGELHNDFGAAWNVETTTAELHRMYPSVLPESPAFDTILLHWGIGAIERHPLFYLKVLAFRTAQLSWLYEPAWMHRGAMTPFAYRPGLLAFVTERPLDALEDALNPAMLIFAMLGLVLTWRRSRQGNLIMLATAAAVLVPYVLLLVQPRYLLPADFVYLIWIGLAAEEMAHAVRRRLPQRVRSIPAG